MDPMQMQMQNKLMSLSTEVIKKFDNEKKDEVTVQFDGKQLTFRLPAEIRKRNNLHFNCSF
jgi:hypothetical protein